MGVAPALEISEWSECLIPPAPVSPALRADVQRRIGVVPGWVRYLGRRRWIVEALCEFIGKPIAHAPPLLYDLAALVVSQDNSCRHCYGAQRTVLRIYGYPDEYIDGLLRDFQVGDLSPGERAALDLARRISRASPRPGRADLEAVVSAGLAREAVIEIAAVAAASCFSNRLSTLVALPPEDFEQMVHHPLFRLVRPLVAWKMRPKRRQPEPAPRPNDGPCARVVAALDGSPMAGVFRRVVDGAWASDVLPLRTKLLMLAVIARALGCPYAEEECREKLRAEGLGTELDEILDTLRSPRLDAREARLVPFARETVRYQTPAIQQRMREVSAGFTPDEILDTAAVLALANAVCRLSVVIDAC